jgi:hypothetical protein
MIHRPRVDIEHRPRVDMIHRPRVDMQHRPRGAENAKVRFFRKKVRFSEKKVRFTKTTHRRAHDRQTAPHREEG